MDSVTLTLKPRDVTGKAVKRLRKQGILPAVVHDHGKDSLVVQVGYQDAHRAYMAAGRHHPVQITANGKKYTALIKSATRDPKYNALTHLVFNAIKANEKVEAEIPIRPRYDEGNEVSPAERASLIVLTNLEAVQVRALPKDLPEVIEYDGEQLAVVGDHVSVSDLTIPANVEVVTPPEQAVATVYEPSALQAANDAAGGTADEEDVAAVETEQEGDAEAGTQSGGEGSGGQPQGSDQEK